MEMIRSRQRTSRTYNEAVVEEITRDIVGVYFAQFVALKVRFEAILAEGS